MKAQAPDNQERLRQIGDDDVVTRLQQHSCRILIAYYLKSDELSASSQVVCSYSAQLSRSAVTAGGVWNGLSLRESGELFGLMRVRSLQMNDAHLYMTPDQIRSGVQPVNEMYLNYFKLFGIDKYLMPLLDSQSSKAW